MAGGRGGGARRLMAARLLRAERAVELRAMPPGGAPGAGAGGPGGAGARANPLFAQGLPQSFGGSGAGALGGPPGAWLGAGAEAGAGAGAGAEFSSQGPLGPAMLRGIDQPLSPLRRRLNRVVYSVPVQLIVVLLVLGDLACLVLEYTHRDASEDFVYKVDLACTVILVLLCLEFTLRLAATQFRAFVGDPWNYLDFFVLFGSVVLVAIDTVDSKRASKIATTGRLVRVVRSAVRGLQVLRVGMKAQQGIKKGATAARMQVSMNKKRFLQQGFNLDLSFINQRLIAMSVPAVGRAQMYRNPLPEVARFFETFYGPRAAGAAGGVGKAHYRIYNVCPEHPYPTELFSGQVVPYQVQDHTPPSLDTLVAMCLDAEAFLAGNSANVIAVHCRGGKGRTGSLCVAWLLYSGAVATIEEGLEKFATQRTDLLMKGKLQGVETPSQVRFLQYLDSLLRTHGSYLGGSEPLRAPAPRPLRLLEVRGERFFARSGWAKKPPPARLFCTVSSAGRVHSAAEVAEVDEEGSFAFAFEAGEGPAVLSKELRVNVFDAGVTGSTADLKETAKAGKEPGLLLFFWAHTAFLEGETLLPLDVVDKACKNKQRWFRPEGCILLRTSAEEAA